MFCMSFTFYASLPSCGNYDAQFWPGWRQEACYPPYYANGSENPFPCNSTSTFMTPQRFDFPLIPHHPPFELSQAMQHPEALRHPHPAISSSISSSSSSSSAEPSSSTPNVRQNSEQINSSVNSSDNQPTSSTKPTSDCSSEIDSTKERFVKFRKKFIHEVFFDVHVHIYISYRLGNRLTDF